MNGVKARSDWRYILMVGHTEWYGVMVRYEDEGKQAV